ncbi:C4-dicarboxylate TRAP transporter substrate-binding protein [Paenirhodobacter sp.]|jgi:TRAP-type C4-dicarboxylate transport system substrate-binding protein|uniref:C4-dicarboxylate TRAP transporter substrate-binding protein n=1 Tax=Paenirhodobacter sp. TaxID=1965326 RepID=UPI003B508208
MNLKSIALATLLSAAAFLPAAAQDVVVKVAYENNPGEPADLVMHRWADLVKEASGGKVALELYPSSQLGAKLDVIEQGLLGVNVITIADVGFLTDYDPDLGILFGPYLTDSPDQLFKIYESDWFKKKEAALREKGVHIVIKNYLYGTRQLLAKKKVEKPEDMAGLKIRVPNNIMQIKAIELMGATPTPMPLGDVYPALTQGVIDGVENPLPVLYGQKLHEQAKELSMISYLTNTSLWLGGEAFFATLDPSVVEMLHETGYKAGLYSQELAVQEEAKMLDAMKAQGVTVTQPDVAAFREKTKPFYTMFPDWTPGLYDQIQAELAK